MHKKVAPSFKIFLMLHEFILIRQVEWGLGTSKRTAVGLSGEQQFSQQS